MTDDRKAGLAFIAGSIGGMVTMAIHPTSAGVLTPAQFERLAVVSGIAHSLAMVSFLVMFLGSIGLTRRLAAREGERPDRLAIAGLVGFGFGAVALLLATAVSGFIVPDIMRHMIHDGAANVSQWRMIIDAVFQFNQAFARIYSVAASVAVMLWSVSALRNGGLGKVIAVYGCLIAPVLIVLIGVGHLRLNVHGMAVVVLAHAIWFVGVGVEMWRGTSDGNHASPVSEARPGHPGSEQ
jgi:heme A synthase